MKFTLTGSLGNISKPLASTLVRARHDVTVISSDAAKKEAIEALGAKAAIGSVKDAAFLAKAFEGADAVYTMVPPNFAAPDYRTYMSEVGNSYAKAIQDAGVKRVVNLSSIGAHLPSGAGPISGLYSVEHALNALEGVAVKHLRAGFFYVNFLHDIGMIKNMHTMGSNFGPQVSLMMVHPNDIAAAAAEELQGTFGGHSVRYVVSDERTPAQVASVLGKAIGKPELPWTQFSDEQSYGGMTQAGMPAHIAETYVEMGQAVDKGILFEDYLNNKPAKRGDTKLEDFATAFAAAYHN